MKDYPFKVYLGNLKDAGRLPERVYLEGFKWDCGWYYGGGGISTKNMWCHFDGCFLEVPDYRGHPLGNFTTPWNGVEGKTVIRNGCAVWEDLGFFLDIPQFNAMEWWRIKDLYKQFYALKAAAEVFQYGGHCTSESRNPAEINKDMADRINTHLQDVVIPEIVKAVKVNATSTV